MTGIWSAQTGEIWIFFKDHSRRTLVPAPTARTREEPTMRQIRPFRRNRTQNDSPDLAAVGRPGRRAGPAPPPAGRWPRSTGRPRCWVSARPWSTCSSTPPSPTSSGPGPWPTSAPASAATPPAGPAGRPARARLRRRRRRPGVGDPVAQAELGEDLVGVLAERRGGPPSAAGVAPNRVGWRGRRVRPATWWSGSSNSPMATACGSRVSSSGERIIANGHPLGLEARGGLRHRQVGGHGVAQVHDRPSRSRCCDALADGGDARVVVAVDPEGAAHAGEVGVGRSA